MSAGYLLGQEAPPESEDRILENMQKLGAPGAAEEVGLRTMASKPHVSVVSASNKVEQLWGAPATVIVLSRDDLEARGYRRLLDVLDDLPGMQVVKTFGDTYVQNYWRGFRGSMGDPYLVLVDGVSYNHLWSHVSYPTLLAFPLSAVARVEVVYGPASPVFGTNAFMGVVNIITEKVPAAEASSFQGSLTGGSLDTRIADGRWTLRRGGLHAAFSFRSEDAEVDAAANERYEYTKQKYTRDPRLWAAPYRLDSAYGSDRRSDQHHRSVDLRVGGEGLEAVVTYLRVDSGYGTVYPTDQAMATGLWARQEWSAYLKHTQQWSDRVEGASLLRWRSSGNPSDSFDVEGYYDPLRAAYLNRYSYWSTHNTSLSLQQTFDVWVNWRLSLTAGVDLERKDLQRNYVRSDPAFYPVESPVKPPNLPEGSDSPSRALTADVGGHLLVKFRLDDHQRLNLGIRQDHNSEYGSATSLRLGYVAQARGWGVKALYGQAFQELSARLLYGGYERYGSNPDLGPERSRTTELAVTREEGRWQHLLSLYSVRNTDIVTAGKNLGVRNVQGWDYHLKGSLPLQKGRQLSLWGFVSRLLHTDGAPLGDQGLTPDGRVGDLATTRAWLGLTYQHSATLRGTLRSRWVGAVDTVASNPIRRLGSYGVLDLNVDGRFRRWGWAVSVENVLDRAVFHPGMLDADAGTGPGRFVTDAAGVTHWLGSGGAFDSSKGHYNSLHPQPGRTLTFTLRILP